jgi:hypothetical protein
MLAQPNWRISSPRMKQAIAPPHDDTAEVGASPSTWARAAQDETEAAEAAGAQTFAESAPADARKPGLLALVGAAGALAVAGGGVAAFAKMIEVTPLFSTCRVVEGSGTFVAACIAGLVGPLVALGLVLLTRNDAPRAVAGGLAVAALLVLGSVLAVGASSAHYQAAGCTSSQTRTAVDLDYLYLWWGIPAAVLVISAVQAWRSGPISPSPSSRACSQ